MIIFIPGFLIATLTFPGVILHEISHKFFCDLYNIAIYQVTYFRVSSNAGHVIHARIYNAKHGAIVSLAPLFINTIVSIISFLPLAIPITTQTSFAVNFNLIDLIFTWIGFSCAFNAFPSSTDLKNIQTSELSFIFRFLTRFCKTLNFLEPLGTFFWFGIILLLTFLFSIFLAWIFIT